MGWVSAKLEITTGYRKSEERKEAMNNNKEGKNCIKKTKITTKLL